MVLMDVINQQQAEREAQRMQANREELVERIMRAVPQDGVVQALEGLFLARASQPREPLHSVLKPSLCVIAQGSKEVLLGDSRYRYDPSHYLISTVELPRVSQILEASREQPYLSFRLELDPNLVGSVMAETGHTTPANHADVTGNGPQPAGWEPIPLTSPERSNVSVKISTSRCASRISRESWA